MRNQRFSGLLPGLVFGALCLVWGSTWLAIKVGLASLPPITFAGIRFVVAAGLLASYAAAKRIKFPKDMTSWRVMIFLSLTQVAVPYALAFGRAVHDCGPNLLALRHVAVLRCGFCSFHDT